MADLDVTPELLRRYDRPVPRYTSYPTADRFTPSFTADSYLAALARADARSDEPLGLYLHLPFCRHQCAYCGCAMVASSDPERLSEYLERLLLEIDRVVAHLPRRRKVAEIQLGGGTPNMYSPGELSRLLDHLTKHFTLVPGAEVAIEVDPREASASIVAELRAAGFTRISFGVQDTDDDVQHAIGRVQALDKTREVTEAARAAGFDSVNIDLIYGLPKQTRDSFARTLELALTLKPDRVALFSFAYIPEQRKNQVRIVQDDLPNVDDKLAIFCDARRAFVAAGYVPIGMDHFARPGDELAHALAHGTLNRTFQGYTVSHATDMLGFGMSAIGEVGGAYAQNEKNVRAWSKRIDEGALPIVRGVALSEDDERRRFVIRALMCRFAVDDAMLSKRFGVTLAGALSDGLERLGPLVEEGLATVAPGRVEVTPLGRLFVRNVAAAFDSYLHRMPAAVPYSRAV
ncbi:MAG: oxygen-independent coproporphyrinogen III oxidase [Deltaproteobacteria bacterium]|nr:oxygen-independent coproporphyrinogen III oxidase [Deltaproteobacteria bacterium]